MHARDIANIYIATSKNVSIQFALPLSPTKNIQFMYALANNPSFELLDRSIFHLVFHFILHDTTWHDDHG